MNLACFTLQSAVKIFVCCSVVFGCYANERSSRHTHSHETASYYKAHVHGHAELQIVLEGSVLTINLISPSNTIFGFEHLAITPTELALVEASETILHKGQTLFEFTGSVCLLTDTSLDLSSMKTSVSHELPEQAHDHAHHKEQVKLKHSEIEVSYFFACQQDKQLTAIKVNLFEKFNSLERLQVQWLSDNQQGVKTLDAHHPVVALK